MDKMSLAKEKLDLLREFVNESLKNEDRASVVIKTVGTTAIACYIYDYVYNHEKSVKFRVNRNFWNFIKSLPMVGDKIREELSKVQKGIKNAPDLYHPTYMMELPQNSKTVEEVIKMIDEYSDLDTIKWREGRVQGAVYDYNEDVIDVTTKAYNLFMWSNPLHADVFRGTRKMEAEVLAMIINFYNGPKEACGLFTSGGTESIGMALLAARNAAFAKGIKWPEVIMPQTAHPAFDKACDYFRIKLIKVPVDPVSYKLRVDKMRSAISSSTCLLVGSAPNYPYGTYDDLSAINELALKYGIPYHVDSCLGSFINVFAADAGFAIPLFDFRLQGVTSISCDTHKYGYTPKGSSVVMFRDPLMRRAAIFTCTDWPGGVYATPTYAGSRSGANIAVCWAAMLKIGKQGYIDRTRGVLTAARNIRKGIEKIDGLHMMGDPIGSVVAFTSDRINIFQLMKELSEEKEWYLGPIQFPSGIHMSVTHTHAKPGVVDQLLKDIEECVKILIAKGSHYESESVAMYGLAQTIPDRSLVSELSKTYTETCLDTN